MADNWQRGGFGLYVHWPFCLSKCPYCDFNSHVAAKVDQDAYRRAYLGEIDRVSRLIGPRSLTSIFFGGGTPSLMPPSTVAAIIDRATNRWQAAADIEITLEANPTSVEAGRFAGFRDAGVNRVSLGLQALDDADLRALGRLHSVAEGLAALDVGQRLFGRVSFDLIYARQDQTAASWERELACALSLGTGHLSLYQLTIEDGTAFGDRHKRGLLRGLPDEDRSVDLFDLTRAMTEAAGLPAYEISNHARPGQECRHNLIYWRGGDYAGIGPGAHGRLTIGGQRLATEALRQPAAWLAAVRDRGNGEAEPVAVAAHDSAEEYLMMALRLGEGADLAVYQDLGGAPLDHRISALAEQGLLGLHGMRLTVSPSGRLVLNGILRSLLT